MCGSSETLAPGTGPMVYTQQSQGDNEKGKLRAAAGWRQEYKWRKARQVTLDAGTVSTRLQKRKSEGPNEERKEERVQREERGKGKEKEGRHLPFAVAESPTWPTKLEATCT